MRLDLRVYKKELRNEMRSIRNSMNSALRKEKDRLIFQRLIRLTQYQKAQTIITYVSTDAEVDTRRLIEKAWEDGKKIAVPRCQKENHTMEMFYINSMEDLEDGAYGILEPKIYTQKCSDWEGTLCIVPAFCNDKKGYRLGYGGGYYDRFLSSYSGITLGINYSECVKNEIYKGRYDVPIKMLLTEKDKFRF